MHYGFLMDYTTLLSKAKYANLSSVEKLIHEALS